MFKKSPARSSRACSRISGSECSRFSRSCSSRLTCSFLPSAFSIQVCVGCTLSVIKSAKPRMAITRNGFSPRPRSDILTELIIEGNDACMMSSTWSNMAINISGFSCRHTQAMIAFIHSTLSGYGGVHSSPRWRCIATRMRSIWLTILLRIRPIPENPASAAKASQKERTAKMPQPWPTVATPQTITTTAP